MGPGSERSLLPQLFSSGLTLALMPCAIVMLRSWFTVNAVLCVTASTNAAAEGWPLPLRFTPPNGKCTSAPMQGRFT